MVPPAQAVAGYMVAAVTFPGPPPAISVACLDIATALCGAWTLAEHAVLCGSLPVVGGSAPPGGPLVGGTVTLAPGAMQAPVGFASAPGSFVSSFPPAGGENVRAVVQALATALSAGFAAWSHGYSAQLVAVGGVAGWVPGPPPAPGPWGGGTNTPLLLSAGASPGDTQMTAQGLLAAATAAVPPALRLLGGQPTPTLLAFLQACCEGLAKGFTQWKATTKIVGSVGAGTSTPPNGVISVGTLSGAKLL